MHVALPEKTLKDLRSHASIELTTDQKSRFEKVWQILVKIHEAAWRCCNPGTAARRRAVLGTFCVPEHCCMYSVFCQSFGYVVIAAGVPVAGSGSWIAQHKAQQRGVTPPEVDTLVVHTTLHIKGLPCSTVEAQQVLIVKHHQPLAPDPKQRAVLRKVAKKHWRQVPPSSAKDSFLLSCLESVSELRYHTNVLLPPFRSSSLSELFTTLLFLPSLRTVVFWLFINSHAAFRCCSAGQVHSFDRPALSLLCSCSSLVAPARRLSVLLNRESRRCTLDALRESFNPSRGHLCFSEERIEVQYAWAKIGKSGSIRCVSFLLIGQKPRH